jgi:Increased loss of mitochondrial DNA protein 1
MPLLPSSLLLRTHSLALLTTSYFLLTAPLTLLNSAPIWILGEAMHVRPAQFQPSINPLTKNSLLIDEGTSELLAVIALVLAAQALIQLVFSSGLTSPSGLKSGGRGGSKARLGEELHTTLSSQASHLTLAFVHVAASGLLVAWIYLIHSSRNLLSNSSPMIIPGSLGSILGNQVVFSTALMDMLFWGYLWTVIRDERREVLSAVQRMRADEDE